MKQYLYLNKNLGRHTLFPVDNLQKTDDKMELVGEISEIVEQNKNLKATNKKLEEYIKAQPMVS